MRSKCTFSISRSVVTTVCLPKWSMTAASSPTPTMVLALCISIFLVRCSINPNSPKDDISVLFSLMLQILTQFICRVVHNFQQLIMDLSVAGQQMRLIGRISRTRKIRYPSPRLFHDQEAGGTVPCRQLMFIEPIEPAGGYPEPIDSR